MGFNFSSLTQITDKFYLKVDKITLFIHKVLGELVIFYPNQRADKWWQNNV